MLLDNGDGTFTGGPLDVLCILHGRTTGRFHVAFFEEKPFPGPAPPVGGTGPVRLKSKAHHTQGNASLAEALGELHEMSTKIQLPEENVWAETAMPWEGEVGIVWVVPDWRTVGQECVREFLDAR